MMIMRWVINSLAMYYCNWIMKYFSNFNIYGINSDFRLLIHHIVYIVNPMIFFRNQQREDQSGEN